ncbi:MAG: peptidoglycan-binding protein [Tildeniella nuda ZEHNDER 1965/U140]|jgi:peptidoglycan hydrolase-like protein with peptidoglycan-binding domain|nr:peptidoglycan-binding protein [Tildeniella nuda ZEHNDER 1965/U140]
METLAFIHAAVAHEDPTLDPEVTAFETIDFKASGSLAMSFVAAGVVATTLSHADQAQATIYYGQRGSGVEALQAALGVSRDGIFGRETLSALRTFQANRGLAVDGIAGRATLPALGLVANLGPGGPGSSGGSVPVSGGAYVTAGSGLIVRNAPAGYAIGSRGYGSRVSLTGAEQYAGGRNWSQLSSGGWVASAYLSSYSGGGNGGTVPIGSGSYAAAGSGLLVRSGPGGYVIGGLGYGAPVRLTGATQYASGRSWSQLTSGGWVASDYIGYR